MSVLHFLFFGTKNKVKAIFLVECQWNLFIIRIYNQITTSSLIIGINKPSLYKIQKFRPQVQMMI